MPPDNLVADLRSNCPFPGPSHFRMWTVIQPANKDFYDETRYKHQPTVTASAHKDQLTISRKETGKLSRPLLATIIYERPSAQI